MSRLEELIKQSCPDGSNYLTLDKVCSVNTGIQLNKTKLLDNAKYPVINGGINPSGYWNEYNTEKNTITISQGGASAGYVNYVKQNFWAGAHCYVVKLETKRINYRYLYHFLKEKEEILQECQQGAGIPGLSKKSIYKLRIPVPPLEVQKEIIHILDNFTLISEKLSENLSAELKVRRKQYEYYRDNLFIFDNNSFEKKLDDVIISLNTGLNPRKFFKLNTRDAQNYYVTIREIKNNKIIFNEGTDRINDEALKLCNNRSNLEKGDIIFSGTGTIGQTALIEETPLNWNIKEGIYVIKPQKDKINSQYLMYLLNVSYIKDIYRKKVAGGTVKSIPMKELKNITIPVPPLEEQKKIVSILDRLDKLYNDISESLPAEIKARQKQYKYYREKLLNFKEL